MSTIASEVARKLLQIKAVKLQPNNPFRWASGINSPIYCDNRILLSYPEVRSYVKDALKDKLLAFPEFDVVAGVATAGIPHGALLADLIGKPFIYVRSKNKGHGRKNLIEGELSPESKVLVIEDLISTGMSSMAACDALINEGSEIVGVLAIFTYGFSSAADLFTERKIPLETLTNYRVLLQEALETNYINSEEKKTLETWNKNPKEWKGIQAT
jgi:orotate phosphoribosyltransferase